jgi:chemotaxis protein histidine kinase CheA/CheY-like chemotaxis protein
VNPAQNPPDDAFLHSAELQSIFRQELEERAANLAEGATRLASGHGDQGDFEDLVRDAHTIKGNAGVMGFDEIAVLAKVLEGVWKDLHEGGLVASPGLGRDLIEAAELIPKLVDRTTISTARCRALAEKLESYRSGDRHVPGSRQEPWFTAGPSPASDRARGAAPMPPPGGVSEPQSPAPAPDDGPDEVDSTSPRPDAAHLPELRQVANGAALVPGRQDLGGLISSLERRIIGTTTRVETGKLYRLINSIAEVQLDAAALAGEIRRAESRDGRVEAWRRAVVSLGTTVAELQERALELASVSLEEVTDTFPQLVRYLSRRTGKEIRFELEGVEAEIDRQIADHLREPLRHLIVNAVDHGIETPEDRAATGKPPTGRVAIRAGVVGHRLQITIEDDGHGIDWDRVAAIARRQGLINGDATYAELARLLFLPEFSTLDEAGELSGDGSGLAAVSELTEMLNGGVTIESKPEEGTSVVLTLPSSWALQDVVLLRAENKQWGIPAAAVLTSMPISAAEIRPGEHRMELMYQGHRRIAISSFAAAVGLPEVEPVDEVLVLATRVGPVAVTVPEIIGRRQVVVKGLGPLLSGVPHLTGAALLGGGEVVVIVEPNRLGERVRTVPAPVTSRARILIVDDSMGVRQLISATLTSHGFETVVAADALEALEKLSVEPFDALVVDYAMPDQNGVDLIESVRRQSIAIPIVMVSAVASAEDQAAAWAAGVDAYLDKFDLRKGVLASTLRSLVQLRSGPRRQSEDE